MSLIYTSPTSRHNLYLGGKADAKSLTTLQQRNVKRILNVTPSKEAGVVAGVPNYFEGSNSSGKSRVRSRFEIIYKRISVYDASTTDMLPYADEIVNFISNGLHHGSVLVHCQRGVSRSATAVIMFLMRKANMTFHQSLNLCRRRRPEVDPIPAFLVQLKKFESDCRSLGYLTALDDADGTLLESGGSVTGRKISANVNNDKRKKSSDSDACEERDGDKKRKVEGTSIRPSIGPTQKVTVPVNVSLKKFEKAFHRTATPVHWAICRSIHARQETNWSVFSCIGRRKTRQKII